MTTAAVQDTPAVRGTSVTATAFLAVLDVLKNEMGRNMAAYFLIIIGVGCLWFGSSHNYSEVIKAGAALEGAALLAFQAKRTPDGNTTTTSTTVPAPNVAEPIIPVRP